MLSEFLSHLISVPFCVSVYVVRVSMLLGLASVLYGSLCGLSFYVTWTHFRSVCVLVLSLIPILVLFYLYVFAVDRAFSGQSLPSDVHNPHQNKLILRQYTQLLLQNK